MTGKHFDDITGKPNDEIGNSRKWDLFNRDNPELFRNTGIRTYTRLFHRAMSEYQELLSGNQQRMRLKGQQKGIIHIIPPSET